ncbi:FAD-binding oxidoreductase [Paracoccus pantotrophus]|uniref:FAD-binding oxidoreductase n=1 Tax=Paracoccus pantotrophus TaxID=82367 RepID=UPI0008E27F6D|nr:FAD-binding oxidoreductase [Paracoccus pantotrophus]MDF3856256.1 FAD-binding oxidoreductase [Paracoccus pantotrophus]SFP03541.1 FAD/FMN-containing dehydrogenase [Paracoccus pantotrophus]
MTSAIRHETSRTLLMDEIRALLGPGAVLESPAEIRGYCTDARRKFQAPALCVCKPRDTAEVAALAKLLHAHGWPMLPQGGNTGLCGGATPDDRLPVIVSTERLNKLRAIDPFGMTIAADAGCTIAQLQEAARAEGLLYPVSLGSEGSCQLGGTIATNAGGTAVLRYGTTRANTLGLEVVLPDGRVLDMMRALHKDTAGYDLKQLFIGAEGTLGIVTGAVMRLYPATPAIGMCWLRIAGPAEALELLQLFRRHAGRSLTAFELMNAQQLANVLDHGNHTAPVEGREGWHLMVELADTAAADLDTLMVGILEQAFEAGLVLDGSIAQNLTQAEAMWAIRHSVTESNARVGVSITSDTAVPVARVPEFIARATEAVMQVHPGILVTVVGHVGDGNIHFITLFAHDLWAALPDRQAVEAQLRNAVNDIAIALGGTFSAEHGVGQTMIGLMERYKAGPELDLMRALKRCIDPDGLMNRDRVIGPTA